MFQQFEALQGAGLQPSAAEALKLLHRLAADPGIVAIMRAHQWTVGKLSEMPPEVCRQTSALLSPTLALDLHSRLLFGSYLYYCACLQVAIERRYA